MKAVIFDMDGVVSDTQKYHSQAESIILARHGIRLSPRKITAKYAGIPDREWFRQMFAPTDKSVRIEKLIKEKRKAVFELSAGHVKSIKGAFALIKKLEEKGFLLAVASSSEMSFIKFVLKELKIKKFFKTVVSTTEVKKGKPAPDIFLRAAKKLGVNPKNCLVIEDGINGMEAAKNAGMKCIGLVKDKNEEYPADILVNSLAEIKMDFLK